jgi:hypothetical protein
MAIARRDRTSMAVVIEDTEGTYKAPQSANDYVQTLKDGAEMTPSQELLERNIFTGNIGKTQSRLGTKSVTGSMPVEFRAGENEGDAPEADALLSAALGGKKTRAAVTTKTGNTTTLLQIEDADISDFSRYDIVLVKEAGQFEMSWVFNVDDTPGASTITLGQGLSFTPSDNVEIAAVTQYSAANSGHPSLSISKYIEDTILEQSAGSRITSMALENFSTGQISTLNFGFEGLSFDRSVTANPYTPNYDDTLPPITLRACVHQDGTQIQVNDLTMSLENTLGFVTSTCSANGRLSSRVTERSISGSFNPYKQDDNVDQFEKFKCNTAYSLFAYAFNPLLDSNCNFTGEFNNGIAILLPNCITTELGESDADGLLVDDVSFEANRGPQGAIDEVKIAFF